MKSSDFTVQQIETIQGALRPGVQYLRKLSERMENRGFSRDQDRTFQLVLAAYDAVFSLGINLHYLSCRKSGHGCGGDSGWKRFQVQPHAGLSDREE